MPTEDSSIPSYVNVPGSINNMAVVSVAGSAFADKTEIENIVVPETIKEIGSYAFSGCTNLVMCSVRGITEIEEGLFNGCSSLERVDLYSCLEIGEGAFQGSKSLSTIGLDSVKHIGDNAFEGCTELGVITSWANCESIGVRAFMNCPKLKTIHLTDKITSISEYAFACCENIDQVIVYGNIDTMGQGAFQSCKKLANVNIQGNIQMIGEDAFAECEKLSSINLKDGLKYIGAHAFEGCSLSNGITIPNTVTEIGRAAFWKCKNLNSINIPSSVTKIEPVAFAECDNLKSITVDQGNVNFCAEDGVLYTKNKDTLKCFPAGKTIAENIFKVETPVTTVEDYAFAGCQVLDIILKSGVTTLGNNILLNSKTILLQVPSSVTKYDYCTFDGTNEEFQVLCMVTAPIYEFVVTHDVPVYCIQSDDEDVIASKDGDYGYFYKLLDDGSVDLLDTTGTVTSTGWAIPSKIKDISGQEKTVRAFTAGFNHKDIKQISIPVTVNTIKENQFLRCNGLFQVDFSYTDDEIGNEGLKVIERSAFANTDFQLISRHYRWSSPTPNTLPASLKVIGPSAFSNCEKLGAIQIPDKVEEILANTFADCIKLQSVTLPSNLKKIDDGAFAGCTRLESITLPDSITYIGSKAFKGCVGLKKITLPKNKDIYIEPDAFEGCPNLLIDIDRDQLNIAEYAEDNEIPYMAGFETNSQILLQIGNIRYMYKLNDGDSNLQLYGWELRNGVKPDEVEEVYIPEKVAGYKVEEMTENLFKGMKNLKRIYIEGSVGLSYAIDNNIPYVLPESTLLNYHGVDTTSTVCGSKKYGIDWIYAGYEDEQETIIKPYTENYPETIIVPYYIDGYCVRQLGPYSFSDACPGMKEVIISDGIESLTTTNFTNCQDLEKLIIPKSVTEIQGGAISNCEKVIIYCYKDSKAEEYARENNITHVLIDDMQMQHSLKNSLVRMKIEDENMYNKIVEQVDVFNIDESTNTIDITPEMIDEVTTLDLSNSSIQNLDGIENFTNLEDLNLAGNSITDISKLADLSNLQSLNLLNNPISSISELSSLSNLRTLKVGNDEKVETIEDLDTIQDLSNLETLTMVYLNIEDLTPFSELNKLTNLDLSFNNISDISELGNITSLESLQLISNKIDNIEGLQTLENLQELNLSYNQIEEISTLESLTNLTSLILNNNKLISISGIENLDKLEEVEIYNQTLSGRAMEGKTVELPEIFKQAKQEESEGYMGLNDFTLENCTQGSDKTKITINTGVQEASVTIPVGNLKGTKLSIAVTEDPNIPKVTLSSIEITQAPRKTSYVEGEKFSTEGMIITAHYSNGTTKQVQGYTVTPSGELTTENTSVTISYTENGVTKTVRQPITVTKESTEKRVTKITLSQAPTKEKYIQSKEDLNVTGGKITVTYSDGTEETIDITKDMVTGFDNSKLGKQTLTITYGGQTTTYEIEVIKSSNTEKKVTKITLSQAPTKEKYIQSKEDLNVTGGKITVTYSDGTEETIDITKDMVTGFDNSKLGKQTLTITYGGQTTTYEIEIIRGSNNNPGSSNTNDNDNESNGDTNNKGSNGSVNNNQGQDSSVNTAKGGTSTKTEMSTSNKVIPQTGLIGISLISVIIILTGLVIGLFVKYKKY